MDEFEKTEAERNEEESYAQRPAWQVWGARIALVLFIGLVIAQILQIARGGL